MNEVWNGKAPNIPNTPKPNTSNTQRPNSAPSGTNTVRGCYSGSFRSGKTQTPSVSRVFSTEKHPSAHAYGITSSGSLTKTPSIETPLGVVRLSSSSSFEPVRMHSGTSTESFRRDISLYKLHAMPVLEEDASSSDDGADEVCGRSKTKDRSKIKKSRRNRPDPEMVEIHLENEENEEAEEKEEGMSHTKKRKFKSFSKFFKGLFTCTRSNKNDIDPDCLLDVSSCPHEAE